MGTPASGTITMYDINAAFSRGYNLNAYRGTTWYSTGGITTGTFSSGALSMNAFYGKQGYDPASTVTWDTYNYGVTGTFTFTAPLYRNALTVQVWGAGGAGGNDTGGGTGTGSYAGTGGASVFYGPYTQIGYGGGGGQSAGTNRYGGLRTGIGGAGGTASGGTTNVSGTDGGNRVYGFTGNYTYVGYPNGSYDDDGYGSYYYVGAGAGHYNPEYGYFASYNGGFGGGAYAGGGNTANPNPAGLGGNYMGGGGSSGYVYTGGKFPAMPGGGGGGGYSARTYGPGGLTAGTGYTVVAGVGGTIGSYLYYDGGAGAAGRVYISWS